MSAPASPLLRSDARRNRDRILDAARDLFAVRGLDVPMASVARRAGVGAATLYRHFPTKESLVTAVFAEQFTACVAVVDRALADPDPWRGFCTLLHKVCDLQVSDRGFGQAFLAAFPDTGGVAAERARGYQGFVELTRRAQAAGRLRPDFVPADLALLIASVCGLVTVAPDEAGAGAQRLVAYLLAAFDARHTGPPLPPARLGMRHLIQAG
ncbi:MULTISPECIES: TetR/AcrR family transcriptional regulator [Actinoplanes]|uniref:TetR/AcrR family transcriptional regulator n=1 Tax=Actinoplanes TaxID=1865 RepID=UPI0005F2C374|nr:MULTISPECIES: TetR/AcrR family transcriptional regulator [Actinoplanes]GLY02689.1 TetR family transcriptional regulator [Actinoplanes sp. NBRC 101535]